MRAYIITEGGKGIGLGHITRCLSLYQACAEKKIFPEFIVNGDGTVRPLLKEKKYRIFNWLKYKQRLFSIIKDADTVIMDSYLADYKLCKKISELVMIPVYIDDNRRFGFKKGIVVNVRVNAQEKNHPRRDGVRYLLGPQYIPVRKEFWHVQQKKIAAHIHSILLAFGGYDSLNMSAKILKLLNKEYPKFIKNVVIGKSFKNKKVLEILKNDKTRLIYSPEAAKMKKLMLASDIAISAGGQTLFELARVGVPTIAIAVADNQLDNIKILKQAGFIKYSGWYKEKRLMGKILIYFRYLRHKRTRMVMSARGRNLIDGQGSRRIIKRIITS
jgi:spore coat polysaccharide biosynthesis predicted glycosyltransferase SpsG